MERRVSSAHFPQSNGRAEAAVKSAKRLLCANTGGGGSLCIDKVSVAFLQYLNTPLRGVNKSPAQLAMGRQLRDGVPVHRQHYKVDSHWRGALRVRERETVRQQGVWMERHGAPRTLLPLMLGTQVCVQNQETKVWDRRGVVTETLPHRQYTVKLDGSGRVTLRNRRHLRVVRGSSRPTQPPPQAPTHHPTRPCTSHSETTDRPQRHVRQPAWMSDYVTGTQ